MSLEIELIRNFDLEKERLQSAYMKFNSNKIPAKLQLDKILSWWSNYKSIQDQKFGFKKEPIIVLIFKDGGLCGILPLMKVRRVKRKVFSYNCMEFITQSFTGNILNIISNEIEESDITRLFKEIKKKLKFEIIDLCYIPDSSILLGSFKNNYNPHSEMPVVHLNKEYNEIRKTYSSNLRNNLNKAQRKIKDYNEKHINGRLLFGKEEIMNNKDRLIQVSNTKLLSPGMHSIYNSKQGDSYFNLLLEEENPYCSIYEAEGELMAYILGFVDREVVHYADGAYNRSAKNYSNISFGNLALDQAIQYFSKKYKLFNLGHGTDRYKMQFSSDTIKTYRLILQGNTLAGKLMYPILK